MDHRPISNDILLRQLEWRYATKQFDPARKISRTDWQTLEQALVLSPSSFGLQPWRFYVVEDPALRAQLPAVSWGQTQPVDASHFVVLAYRRDLPIEHIDRFVERTAEVRGVTAESLAGFRDMLTGFRDKSAASGRLDLWSSRQVYIALGNLLTAAALLGIDACPMEGFDPDKYDEILGLAKDGYTAVAACALGYRAAEDRYAGLAKVRFPRNEVIHHL